MERSVTQRVNDFLKEINVTPNALSKIINIGQPTLSKQLKDGGCGASLTTVVLLLETYPDLSAEWLLRGDGNMERGKETASDTERIAELKANIGDLREMVAFLKGRVRQLEGEKELATDYGGVSMAAESVEYNKKGE